MFWRNWAQHKITLASIGGCLHEFRPAAATWRGEARYANELEDVGFRTGLGTPVSFCHAEKDVNFEVHSDDFTFTGGEAAVKLAEELLDAWYEVKVRALGPKRL